MDCRDLLPMAPRSPHYTTSSVLHDASSPSIAFHSRLWSPPGFPFSSLGFVRCGGVPILLGNPPSWYACTAGSGAFGFCGTHLGSQTDGGHLIRLISSVRLGGRFSGNLPYFVAGSLASRQLTFIYSHTPSLPFPFQNLQSHPKDPRHRGWLQLSDLYL